MPMGSVVLRPGVNTQYTPSLAEAGVVESDLIRYKDQIIQKLGGWTKFYSATISSTIRSLHAWQASDGQQYLGVGATEQLGVINQGALTDITPQTRTSNFTPDLTTTAGSTIVSVIDPGSSATTYDTIFFNTPVSIGGLLLKNAFKVRTILGSSGYQIAAATAASSAVTSSGTLPVFTTIAGSAIVTVTLPNHGFLAVPGLQEGYYAETSVGGLTIQGAYQTQTVIDTTSYTIGTLTQASSAGTATMNSSQVQIVYYIGLGPPAAGSGYGLGGYGLGGYGQGAASVTTPGTPITATDWSMDNWGEVLLAVPFGGPIYSWSPNSGFGTASVVDTGPFFNGGIFISQPNQILVAWYSTQSTGVWDPLIVRWSNSGDYTDWTVDTQSAAGSFHISGGSLIRGGIQAPSYGVIWTDVDCWLQQYVGGTVTFNHTRVGSGCGLVGPHAAGVIGGVVYWCSDRNFYMLSGGGVRVVPCSVWDFIFQNLDEDNEHKIVCAPNSMFNEITWYFPAAGGTGENDSYVKYNLLEGAWDYGSMGRNAWIDVTALGHPIGSDIDLIYQHETSNNGDGQPVRSRFETGYWAISDGNEMAFVDWFLPDMKFGTYGGTADASVQITFQAVDYPGATVRTYGPYTFSSTTEYLNPRLRGRLMSIIIESEDSDSFWRIGRCRYRYASAGRR